MDHSQHRFKFEISEAPVSSYPQSGQSASSSGATASKIIMSEDVRNSKNNGQHECFGCPKVFTHKWMLDRHILTHTGEQPFACSICLRRFSLQASCLRHVRHVHKDQTDGGLISNYVVKTSELEKNSKNIRESMQC